MAACTSRCQVRRLFDPLFCRRGFAVQMPKNGIALNVRSSVGVAEVTKFETSACCRRDRKGGRVCPAPPLHPSRGILRAKMNARRPRTPLGKKENSANAIIGTDPACKLNVTSPFQRLTRQRVHCQFSILRSIDWRSALEWSNQRACLPRLRSKRFDEENNLFVKGNLICTLLVLRREYSDASDSRVPNRSSTVVSER